MELNIPTFKKFSDIVSERRFCFVYALRTTFMFGQSTIVDGGCSCIRLLIRDRKETGSKNKVVFGNIKMAYVDEYYGLDEESRKVALITVRGIAYRSIHPFTEIWELRDSFDSHKLTTKETFLRFKRNAENLIKYI